MAKPTTEVLALPDFPVTIVRNLDGNFIHDDISLQEIVKNTDKGFFISIPKTTHLAALPKLQNLLNILIVSMSLVMTLLVYHETVLNLMKSSSINMIYRFH